MSLYQSLTLSRYSGYNYLATETNFDIASRPQSLKSYMYTKNYLGTWSVGCPSPLTRPFQFCPLVLELLREQLPAPLQQLPAPQLHPVDGQLVPLLLNHPHP